MVINTFIPIKSQLTQSKEVDCESAIQIATLDGLLIQDQRSWISIGLIKRISIESGAKEKIMKHNPGFLKLVNQAKPFIEEVSSAQIAEQMQRESLPYLIDVREDKERGKGYIPSSIHLGKGVIEAKIESVVEDTETEIVLYCRGGYRSLLAAFMLRKMGYKDVKSLQGGCTAWIEAGFDFEGSLLTSNKQFNSSSV